MTTAETIKALQTCESVLAANGVQPGKKSGTNTMYVCPFHPDKTPSLSVNHESNLWKCFGCGKQGDVVTMLAELAGLDVKDYLRQVGKEIAPESSQTIPIKVALGTQVKPRLVATYSYQDANGREVYQSLRYEPGDNGKPKKFSQRRVNPDGSFEANMKGVERVLYRYPKIRASQLVWVVEGEKDVESLENLGIVATCNVGGAQAWLASYADYLAGKDLVLCGDNDKPGQDLMDQIQASCVPVAKTIRRIKVPEFAKDITEYLASMTPDEDACAILQAMVDKTEPLYRGESLPLLTMEELEREYISFIQRSKDVCLDLGAWLPSLSGFKLTPGEMFVIMAETGVGKTALLQNIYFSNSQLPTVFFELELAKDKMFRRTIQTAAGVSKHFIESRYMTGSQVAWRESKNTDNLIVCVESSLSVSRIESIIRRSELKTGKRPAVVLIDYIQLAQGSEKDRYARFSDIAENCKRLAKECEIVLGIASQVGRKEGRKFGELSISDAKESGSIENSCGLLLGASRNPDKKSEMCIQVLKATDFGAGLKITTHFDFETMRIREPQSR
jgi:hypothetical protein